MAKANKGPGKFIFVTGGVISGIGKGITTASIARILKDKGYSVTCIKCDMYVNLDAGTMRPTVHGEVFVTVDGMETDQDVGHYERFLDVTLSAANYTTQGQVYQSVIARERNLEYDGICVEVVPHIPLEIIRRIKEAARSNKAEITVIEIGGTVGEYQQGVFLEAIRMMIIELGHENVINIHVAYLPIPEHLGEMKSKPVQHSVRLLNAAGLQPEFVVARSERPIDQERRGKVALFCSVPADHVISNPNVDSIYAVSEILEEQKLGDKILGHLALKARGNTSAPWKKLVKTIRSVKEPVTIGIVGKYFNTGDFTLQDSYVSVLEAIKHAAWAHKAKPVIQWIDSRDFETNPRSVKNLSKFDGIVVPGGFGSSGITGKLNAIRYVREQGIPYFGLCYGMQLATVEFARNVAGLRNAHSTEVDAKTPHPVIHIMESQKANMASKNYGATMRLGAYPAVLTKDSIPYKAYKTNRISERHRHRYEFNNDYRERLEQAGLVIAATSPDKHLVEIVQVAKHPWFVGTQFHPEFQSSPLHPHPLFRDFIGAALKQKRKRTM